MSFISLRMCYNGRETPQLQKVPKKAQSGKETKWPLPLQRRRGPKETASFLHIPECCREDGWGGFGDDELLPLEERNRQNWGNGRRLMYLGAEVFYLESLLLKKKLKWR